MRYESAETPRHNVGVSLESQEAADEQARQMDLNFCDYCSGCSDCSDCRPHEVTLRLLKPMEEA